MQGCRVLPEVLGTETGLVEYFHFNNGIQGGNNTAITSFAGGKAVSTITPRNMAMDGTSSNFIARPTPVNPVDTSLTVVDTVITSNATGAIYQWLDCDNAFAIIPGATSQSFTATANGNYSVEIAVGSCIDTSSCVQILSLGISSTQIENISIYPNPISDELIIENKGSYEKIYYEILQSKGYI